MTGLKKSIVIIVFSLPFLVCEIIDYFSFSQKEYVGPEITILVPRGSTLKQIADTLEAHQLIAYKQVFTAWAKALGYENRLQAGLFTVPCHLNYVQLIYYLSKPHTFEIQTTLIEGWELKQYAAVFERKLDIDAIKFQELCNDTAFIHSLGLESNSLIGYLLPETYSFYWGIREKALIKFLVEQTQRIFEDDRTKAAMEKLNMNMNQIITLASIVEGEAMLDEERPVIASVYHNRLKRGMRLQADPTIQFIIEGPPRRLLFRDLKIDSPYNTYRYAGLPPGPINNPGKNSILAVLFPAETKYLFFVANGEGGHVFSRTNAEHARAKANFYKIRRRERLKKKMEKYNQ